MINSTKSAETPKIKISILSPPQNSPSRPCTAENGSNNLHCPSNTEAAHHASEKKPVPTAKTPGVSSVFINSKKLNSSASPDPKTLGRCSKTWLSIQKNSINLWAFPIESSPLFQVLSTMLLPRNMTLKPGSLAMRHTASWSHARIALISSRETWAFAVVPRRKM